MLEISRETQPQGILSYLKELRQAKNIILI